MFGVLFSKEIREHLMTFRFGAALITTFVLVVVSAWVLGDDFSTRQTAYTRLSAHYQTQLQEARVISQVYPFLHRPPTALSIFSQGENPHLGNVVEVRRWSVPQNATGSLSDNQFLAAYPTFDLLSIFTLVISLFGILFTYDAFSGERVNGTLKVICSYKVSRSSIFFAKFTAGVVVLAIPFVISLLSALLVLQFLHNISFSGMEWVALISMVLVGILYGAIFVGIGMLSSALFRNSSSSLVLSLLVWSLGVFLIPIASGSISTTLVPLASSVEIDKFKEETLDAINEEQDGYFDFDNFGPLSFMQCSLGGEGSYTMDASMGGINYLKELTIFNESRYQERASKIWSLMETHNALKTKQREASELLASPAPASHLRRAFTALSGTHYAGYDKFMKTARRYRAQMLSNMRQKGYFSDNTISFFSRLTEEQNSSPEKFEQRVAMYQKFKDDDESLEQYIWGTPLDLSFLPEFQGGSEKSDFEAVIQPAAVLALMLLILLLSSYFVFVRYDVR